MKAEKRLYLVEVRGHQHTWGLPVMSTQENVDDWRNDGLRVDGPVYYTIPEEIVNCGSWAIKLWFLISDVFNFRNPWREDRPPATQEFMQGGPS